MVMGGFVLHDDDCEIFPIVFGTKFRTIPPDSEPQYHTMKPGHFEFKTFYKTELVKTGQKLRTKAHPAESQPVIGAMTHKSEPSTEPRLSTPTEKQDGVAELDHLS
jgi:hypothetical protein